MTKPLGELLDLVLGPLRDRADSAWEHGPPGKWTPAQIVEHLALGLNLSAETFRSRRNHAPMSRRRRTPAETVARLLIFGFRWVPPGRKAPERATPAPGVTRAAAEAHFVAGVEGRGHGGPRRLPERRAPPFCKPP